MERVGGKRKDGDLTASQIFSRRLREVRKFQGWTQEQLAAHLRAADVKFSQETVAKLEKDTIRADRLTVNEWLAISYAVSVSPLHMLVPLEEWGREPPLEARGTRLYINRVVQPLRPSEARDWLRGLGERDDVLGELPGQDPRVFAVQRPDSEQAAALARLPQSYVGEITRAWRPPATEEETP